MAVAPRMRDCLKECIDKTYEKLAKSEPISGWTLYNGREKYLICGIDEHILIQALAKGAPLEQRDIYVLDIGAGDFQWCKALVKFINRNEAFPITKRVHVIGVRGEPYEGVQVVEKERCILYRIGALKVEDITTELIRNGLEGIHLDLVVSRWAIRHLVNPVETVKAVFDLLRPRGGVFLFDGFFFLKPREKLNKVNVYQRMVQLLLQSKVDFLARKFREDSSVDHFILQRSDERTFKLDLVCEGITRLDDSSKPKGGLDSKVVVHFSGLKERKCFSEVELPHIFYGNRALHDWLKAAHLIPSHLDWGPLKCKDQFPLHEAILKNQIDRVATYVGRDADLKRVDRRFNTAVHIAIEKNRLQILELLLRARVPLEGKNSKWETPLELAIFQENFRAIELLIEGGVAISENEAKQLKKLKLSHLLTGSLEADGSGRVEDSIKKRRRGWV